MPPGLSSINVKLDAQVQNVTAKNLETLTSVNETWHIQEHSGDEQTCALYLRKIKKDNYIYIIGKNGEPIAHQNITVTL